MKDRVPPWRQVRDRCSVCGAQATVRLFVSTDEQISGERSVELISRESPESPFCEAHFREAEDAAFAAGAEGTTGDPLQDTWRTWFIDLRPVRSLENRWYRWRHRNDEPPDFTIVL